MVAASKANQVSPSVMTTVHSSNYPTYSPQMEMAATISLRQITMQVLQEQRVNQLIGPGALDSLNRLTSKYIADGGESFIPITQTNLVQSISIGMVKMKTAMTA